MEVRLEYLRPRQIEEAIAERPVLFMPLGTIEWHGRHNTVGLDALKVHQLCIRAAREGGGLVMPPLYGGMGGLNEPCTFVIEPEDSYTSLLLEPWLQRQCAEAIRLGFRAVIMLTGHYGPSQQLIVRETAVRMTRILHRPILGTPEHFLALDEGYFGDHAAFFETSLMMHLFPESVDLGELGDPPHQGVGGRDPKQYATAADGKRLADAIVGRLVRLAQQMPEWDDCTVERFVRAEGELVARQFILGSREGKIDAAWRRVPEGALAAYPEFLTEGKFEELIDLYQRL